MKYWLLIVLVTGTHMGYAQQKFSIRIVQDSLRSSFRGLSVVSDDVVWVSGSNGTVGRTTNGGTTWQWMPVPGFEKRDFRDIEAFDSLTAVIMAVDNPADILKTTDGGKSWKNVFHKEQEGMFLDAMDFDRGSGICIGDPITPAGAATQQFFVLTTSDSGSNWQWVLNTPSPEKGEAIFAGSGTNIHKMRPPGNAYRKYAFISGGVQSRLFIIQQGNSIRQKIKVVPVIKGRNTTGAFSFCTSGKKQFYITGGDYNEYWKDSGNVVYTFNAGKTWKRSSAHGYRSCIIQYNKKTFITCGINGVDISRDGCKNWQLIYGDGAKGKTGFNVCAKSKNGKVVYFAGVGNIGKLVW